MAPKMNGYQNYSIENQISGWTRIDMLLVLYDRAISEISAAQNASLKGDTALMAKKLIECNRFLLALHSGLNIDEYPLAVDIARLLHFVMYQLEQKKFSEAIYFLEKLKSGYEGIRDEADAMEKQGKFTTLETPAGLDTVA